MGHHLVKTESWSDPLAPLVLSGKEKAKLIGKCYLCRESGHLAQNCPQENEVKASTGKPPYASNFNVELEEDEVKALKSLPLGIIDIEQAWEPVTSDQLEN
jgi:Zinc knuckle